MPKGPIILGLTSKKAEKFPDWHHEVITKAELISYHDVSGCYVLRPNSYQIWEFIQQHLDAEFKADGVRNAYFPLFISEDALSKEADHLSDFSPEVAWVTKSGDKTLDKQIAIRPTSETSMYPYFSDWLNSYRDLPMKFNQWNNVVRWEFKNPTPFIRSREFLWQEGHTAHMTQEEAENQVLKSLNTYQEFYKEMLCLEVIPGMKTPKEKFAGADYTMTVEAFIPEVGRGIQAATSHYLGQNFAKMFNIIYEDPTVKNQKNHVYQTSWGLTTRSIGILIMTHADDVGMVLPPKVAFYQVVIVPTGLNKKTTEETKEKVMQRCRDLETKLNQYGVRCHADLREIYSPPWKYNYWEMRGIPLRVEVGPRELDTNGVRFVNRVTKEKTDVVIDLESEDDLKQVVNKLSEIERTLYHNSQEKMKNSVVYGTKWDELIEGIKNKKMIGVPFCKSIKCEEGIKEQFNKLGEEYQGTKTLCTPINQSGLDMTGKFKCINPECETICGEYTLFGKSY